MAKKIYVGVNSAARRVKKAYIGVNGLARRIKKAYIGIGGVARPCFSTEPEYWGETSQPLSTARIGVIGNSVGNYALFGGGYTYTSKDIVTSFKTVDVYNDKLTIVSGVELSQNNMECSATANNNYAFFYKGGNVGTLGKSETWTFIYSIDVFNKSLTRTTLDDNNIGCWGAGATSLNNYAIFAGGFHYVQAVSLTREDTPTTVAYNESLTKTVLEDMTSKRSPDLSVTIGNYALFINGSVYVSSQGGYITNVYGIQAYDSSLTKVDVTYSNTWNDPGGVAVTGDYAVSCASTAISKSLTYQNVSSPFTATHGGACISLDDYALFALGYTKNYSTGTENYTGNVEIMNKSLTKTNSKPLQTVRSGFGAATVGDYALFAGGEKDSTFYDTVEAITI